MCSAKCTCPYINPFNPKTSIKLATCQVYLSLQKYPFYRKPSCTDQSETSLYQPFFPVQNLFVTHINRKPYYTDQSVQSKNYSSLYKSSLATYPDILPYDQTVQTNILPILYKSPFYTEHSPIPTGSASPKFVFPYKISPLTGHLPIQTNLNPKPPYTDHSVDKLLVV